MKRESETGWEQVASWYQECVAEKGHYYHQSLILPALQKDLRYDSLQSVLDLGCGQGLFERVLPPKCAYTGVDASPSLLKEACALQKKRSSCLWLQKDLNDPLGLHKKFDLVLFLLSLQNIKRADIALQSAAEHLLPNGEVVLVLNHPCFRIPRQSDWAELPSRGLARQIHHYKTPLEIPIQAHPGQKSSAATTSYHHSLEDLFFFLESARLKVTRLKELYCTKSSAGAKARLENRARAQIPLFLYLVARF